MSAARMSVTRRRAAAGMRATGMSVTCRRAAARMRAAWLRDAAEPATTGQRPRPVPAADTASPVGQDDDLKE